MTIRHVRSALTASLLTLTAVALAPATGLAQNAIPEQGAMVTMVGCFVQGQIKDHETLVLVRAIVGTVESVADASCAMNPGDVPVKLQNLKRVGLDESMTGRWIQIVGKLEGDHRKDGIREVHVKSFSLVPVVVPPPPVAAVVIPEPAPQAAAPAPIVEPAPAPVPTTGVTEERKKLPKDAMAIVQQYQDENWRRLRVNDICSDIKRRLNEEAGRWAAGGANKRNRT